MNFVPHKDKQLKTQLKKDTDKKLIQNWRSISLINFDVQIISKALAKRLKNVHPLLISDNESSFVMAGSLVNIHI